MALIQTHTALPQSLPPLSRLVMRLAVTIVTWEDRHRTRKGLNRLDPHLLRDIGLDPLAAGDEATKPFWRD